MQIKSIHLRVIKVRNLRYWLGSLKTWANGLTIATNDIYEKEKIKWSWYSLRESHTHVSLYSLLRMYAIYIHILLKLEGEIIWKYFWFYWGLFAGKRYLYSILFSITSSFLTIHPIFEVYLKQHCTHIYNTIISIVC